MSDIDSILYEMAETNLREFARVQRRSVSTSIKREAAETYTDSADSFDGWLNITLNLKNGFDFTSTELERTRDQARVAATTNEIAKNILRHVEALLVGKRLLYAVVPFDGNESLKKDTKVSKMLENWRQFCTVNKFDARVRDFAKRAVRDGEAIMRVFRQGGKVPFVRFVDPEHLVDGVDNLGVEVDSKDREKIKAYIYKHPDADDNTRVPAESIIHYKRNVDFETYRGITDFYPVFTNLRRVEKLIQNVSTLTQIQSSIALIRKHKNSTAAKVSQLLSKTNDQALGVTSTGAQFNKRRIGKGLIIDAPEGTEYDYPSMTSDPEKFLKTLDKELSHIAANFVVPVDWLLSHELTEPLLPGSPTVAHWATEQAKLYEVITELFWLVQSLMGIDPDKYRGKYEFMVFGPMLSTSKAVDAARIAQILVQVGAQSPQQISRMFGINYDIARSEIKAHYDNLADGEPIPGSVGATNSNASHNGVSANDGSVKPDNATGGNNNV